MDMCDAGLPLTAQAINVQISDANEMALLQDLRLHHLFERQVEKTPEAIALEWESGAFTYEELNVRANRLARQLVEAGVDDRPLVAISLERTPEMVIAVLATLKAAAAYVPVDPGYPLGRKIFMLEDCGAGFLLTHSSILPTLTPLPNGLSVVLLDDDSLWAAHSGANLEVRAAQPQIAYVIYTSGSTGRPKGVVVEHAGLVNLALAQISAFGFSSTSRVLQAASFSFDASVSEIAMALCSGARLCLPPPDCGAGTTLARVLDDMRITHVTLTPTVLTSLGESRIDSLECLVMAGEATNEALIRRWIRQCRLFNAYGPTEATVCASILEYEHPRSDNSIGKPMANVAIYLLDEERRPVVDGAAGEIFIGGAGVAKGYLNRPDLTGERFVADPFAIRAGRADARMYGSGDLGRRLPDGTIEFIGRRDQQIKIRGMRAELGEIEARMRERPGVQDAVAALSSGARGEPRLVGYFIGERDIPASVFRAHLARSLPGYMIPSHFMRLSAWPVTANGKLSRAELPEPEAAATNPNAFEKAVFEAPETLLEVALADIWIELLQVERVGRHDDFFELGGDSLKALELVFTIEKRFGCKIAPAILVKAPTISLQASVIDQRGLDGASSVIPLNSGGGALPLFCLHGVLGDANDYFNLANDLDQIVPVYGVVARTAKNYHGTLIAEFIRDIRKAQPTGPYRIAGYSFGGSPAFIVAQRLYDDGEDVTLFLIDSYRMSYGILAHTWLPRLRRAIAVRDLFGAVSRKIDVFCNRELPSLLTGREANLTQRLIRALCSTRYAPFRGRAILFQCTRNDSAHAWSLKLDGLNGWSRLLAGQTEVVPIDVDHLNLLKRSHIPALIGLMIERLVKETAPLRGSAPLRVFAPSRPKTSFCPTDPVRVSTGKDLR